MAKRKREPMSAMDALVAYMKGHPQAVYADVQAVLTKQGHKIFPIMWGRAQVMLGRVKAKKRVTRKSSAGKGPVSTTGRGPGNPRRNARVGTSSGDVIVAIDASDLAKWQRLVEVLNSERKVALQFDGSTWNLVTA